MSQNIPTSLIVLKHTITEGRIPTPDILEVGEVALGLYKGQESIWSKNNAGDIVNFRSPRHDLMWGDLFLKYNTRSEFQTDLSLGRIKETSIVFIKEEKLLWTDGIFYNSSYTEDELEIIISNFILKLPKGIYQLNNNSTSNEILSIFETIENFKSLVEKAIKGGILSELTLPEGGSIPVSIVPKIQSPENYELKLEWLLDGNFIKLIINLDIETFSIIRSESNLSSYSEIESKVYQYLEFNKNLVSPIISGNWTFYNTSDEVVNLDSVNKINPSIEIGYSAKFTGTYSWKSKDGYKNPITVSSDSNWSDLPDDGVDSSVYTSSKLTQNNTILITLKAPKTGMMVSGSNIIPASGDDSTTAKRTLTFLGRAFCGQVKGTNDSIEITEELIKSLPSELVSGKSKKIVSLTVEKENFFIYAYPKSFGKLNQIIQDGASPILGAFNIVEINITNSAGATIPLYVYVSNNPGIFTDATVEFK